MVVGIFLKSSKISNKLDFSTSPSLTMVSECTCSSSKLSNSSGEYSLVVVTVIKIETTKIIAPIINDQIKFAGTTPETVSFDTPNQLVKA